MNTKEDEFKRIEAEVQRRVQTAEGDDTQVYKKPWVGLTDEDLDYLCHLAYTGDEEFALTVQAALKKKNT